MAPITQARADRLQDVVQRHLRDEGIRDDVLTTLTRTSGGSLVLVVPGHDDDARAAARAAARAIERDSSAYVPSPHRSLSAPPREHGLIKTDDGSVETPDGYRFEFDDNQMKVYFPGRDGPATVFDGDNVTESDGTTWRAEEANYFLPNRAMFRPQFNEDGRIEGVQIVNGDALVEVEGIDSTEGGVRIHRTGGGYDWREATLEDTYGERAYHLAGKNRESEDDVVWHVDPFGKDGLRRVLDDYDPGDPDGRYRLGGRDYYVDPDLVPEFGTPAYESMLRAELKDLRAALVAEKMDEGKSHDAAHVIADFMLGSDGTYEDYAKEIAASLGVPYPESGSRKPLPRQILEALLGDNRRLSDREADNDQGRRDALAALSQLMQLQQMFGGLAGGTHASGFDSAMSSLAALRALLAAQGGVSSDYAAWAGPARTHIPSAAARMPSTPNAAMASAAALLPVVKAIETVAQDGMLRRFPFPGSRAGAIHHDPLATLRGHQLRDALLDGRHEDPSVPRRGRYGRTLSQRATRQSDRSHDDDTRSVSKTMKRERLDVDETWAREKATNLASDARRSGALWYRDWWPGAEDESDAAQELINLEPDARLAVMEKVSDADMRDWMDDLADEDEARAGNLLAKLVTDAKRYPVRANEQLARVLGGMDHDIASDDDAVAEMIGALGGKDAAVEHLKHVNTGNLAQLRSISSENWIGGGDEDALNALDRAEAANKKLGPDAQQAVSEARAPERLTNWFFGLNDDTGTAVGAAQKLTAPTMSSSERVKALGLLSDSEMTEFGEALADDEEAAGGLLAALVKDVRQNRAAEPILRKLLTGIEKDWDEDDSLKEMYSALGGEGGAVTQLRHLDASTLSMIRRIADRGYTSEDDKKVINAVESVMARKGRR